MSLDSTDLLARSRDEPAFSSSDEGEAWLARWCHRCLRDAPFRHGINATGCPILALAFSGRTPAEWRAQSAGGRSTFVCIEFRAQGGARSRRRGEPQAEGLFERPTAVER